MSGFCSMTRANCSMPAGTTVPFDAATIAAEYPSRDAFLAQFAKSTKQAVKQGFLLPEEAEKLRLMAAADAHSEPARTFIRAGIERTADYQDAAYARQYLDRLKAIADADRRYGNGSGLLLAETARELALGMVPPEGLQSHIREAVEVAGAQRIGHGVDIAHERDSTGLLRLMREQCGESATARIARVEPVPGGFACPIEIRIADSAACPAFAGRLIRGVKNGPSPLWLQEKLTAIGLRSIGFCAKLLYEAIEEIDESQVEAVRATGASFLQWINYAEIGRASCRERV